MCQFTLRQRYRMKSANLWHLSRRVTKLCSTWIPPSELRLHIFYPYFRCLHLQLRAEHSPSGRTKNTIYCVGGTASSEIVRDSFFILFPILCTKYQFFHNGAGL